MTSENKSSFLEAYLDKYAQHPTTIAHEAILDFTATLCSQLNSLNWSKSELARQADLDPAQVSRVMGGTHNVTLITLAKLAVALDCKLKLDLQCPAKEIAVYQTFEGSDRTTMWQTFEPSPEAIPDAIFERTEYIDEPCESAA